MKKILLSTLVLGTMSSFALAGEPAKLDESQLRSVAAGSGYEDGCGCYTPSGFALAAASKQVFVGVKDDAVGVTQGPGTAIAGASALVSVFNVVNAAAGSY